MDHDEERMSRDALFHTVIGSGRDALLEKDVRPPDARR